MQDNMTEVETDEEQEQEQESERTVYNPFPDKEWTPLYSSQEAYPTERFSVFVVRAPVATIRDGDGNSLTGHSPYDVDYCEEVKTLHEATQQSASLAARECNDHDDPVVVAPFDSERSQYDPDSGRIEDN